jgi:hypothetical protein
MRVFGHVLFQAASALVVGLLGGTAMAAVSRPQADYGVLAQTVATAGTLIASAGALLLCWKGRFSWEPAEEDVPRSAQKFGGLIVAVLNAIIWYRFVRQQLLTPDDLIRLSGFFVAVGLIAMLIYSVLVGVFVYEKIVVVGGTETGRIKIIGGFWLTDGARQSLTGGDPRPLSVGDLFKGAAYEPDYVWSRISRALAKVSFQVSYIVLVAAGTCALTSISLLISREV